MTNLKRKAFALLEFLIFILVLSILISVILGNFAIVGIENLRISKEVALDNVPICNKIIPHCVFQSNILESTQVYEINATIP